jgi:antitoxin component of MazEF toxin-antitoxin module
MRWISKSARDRRSLRRDREVLLCHERRQRSIDRDDRAADLRLAKLHWETQNKSARDRRSLRRDREVLLCHERRQPLVDRDDRAADLGEADGAGDVGHEASDELVARRARL